MSNGTIPTPESNARNIAALTSAVDMLVSQFIRPAAQQANGNRETLDEVVELLSRHAEGLLTLEQRLESLSELVARTAQQQQANAQQIAQNAEAITQFDTRLEETRQLVADNGSRIAQLTVKQDRNANQITQLAVKQDRNADQIAELRDLQQESTERLDRKLDRLSDEVQAVAEATRTQLAAIIGNGRRIDRLEQQAS